MAKFLVTADHPVAKYNFRLHPATVNASGPNGFYCIMTTLGCGKDYATAELAIRGLVADHGYRNINIYKV